MNGLNTNKRSSIKGDLNVALKDILFIIVQEAIIFRKGHMCLDFVLGVTTVITGEMNVTLRDKCTPLVPQGNKSKGQPRAPNPNKQLYRASLNKNPFVTSKEQPPGSAELYLYASSYTVLTPEWDPRLFLQESLAL